MTWQDVARRDLRSVYRSRLGPAVAILTLAFTVGSVALMAYLSNGYRPDTDQAVLVLSSVLSFVVPLMALLSSYSAIVGERTTGSVRFLLGLPNSRAEAFLGKFVSRSVVVLAPLAAGMFGATVVVEGFYQGGSFAAVPVIALVSAILALLFVGFGLTASAMADTDTQAVSLAVGIYAVLRAGWPVAQWLGTRHLDYADPKPEWYFWFGRINPLNAYIRVTDVLRPEMYHPLITRTSELDSVILSPEFALVVLACWTISVPLVGLAYFRQRDML
ncbi:ABC transporter permease [Halorussus halophilus]|uniref:ABC transporter permease n=1 Tax=Halorussus halophilus TaxID=2650975 RepID=UPI0013018C6D|nr:ABC transporter permease subunit [Halorussus halophilus]